MILRIPGIPVPQGSMRNYPSGGMAHSNEKALLGYRSDIINAWHQSGLSLIEGPVRLECLFAFPRPAWHVWPINRNHPKWELRENAPMFHVKPPDVDKLLRAVMDALTGHAYHDDAQVARIRGAKTWDINGWTRIEVIGEDL